MTNRQILNLAGVGLGVALASGCISRGSASFPGAGTAEPDLSLPGGENPMPAAVAPVQPAAVTYAQPAPAKTPEYWEQVNDPYAELSQGRPYVGQGFTIAPPVGTAKSGASTYTVKKGDIFGNIAKSHGVTVKALKAANPGIDYDRIKVGQKLNIPGKGAAKAEAHASSSGVKATGGSSSGVHVVQKGEIFGRIARQNGVTFAALKAANPGVDPNRIKVGQKLNIPGKGAPASAAESKAAPSQGSKSSGQGAIVVDPVRTTDLPPPPAPEVLAEPTVEIAPPVIDTAVPQPFTEAASAATTTYLANGSEDLYGIAVSKTMGIAELERLNPSLAGDRSRILPAGTPVVIPVR